MCGCCSWWLLLRTVAAALLLATGWQFFPPVHYHLGGRDEKSAATTHKEEEGGGIPTANLISEIVPAAGGRFLSTSGSTSKSRLASATGATATASNTMADADVVWTPRGRPSMCPGGHPRLRPRPLSANSNHDDVSLIALLPVPVPGNTSAQRPPAPRRIPRRILQTNCHRTVPPVMHRLMSKLVALNPTHEYLYFSDAEAEAFVRRECGQRVWRAYLRLIAGAFRADLWRYCALWKLGGVYVDADMEPLVPFDVMIQPMDEWVSAEDNGHGWIYNAFIASVPGMPLTYEMMMESVRRIERRFHRGDTLAVTGPCMAASVFVHVSGTSLLNFDEVSHPRWAGQVRLFKFQHREQCAVGLVINPNPRRSSERILFYANYVEKPDEMRRYLAAAATKSGNGDRPPAADVAGRNRPYYELFYSGIVYHSNREVWEAMATNALMSVASTSPLPSSAHALRPTTEGVNVSGSSSTSSSPGGASGTTMPSPVIVSARELVALIAERRRAVVLVARTSSPPPLPPRQQPPRHMVHVEHHRIPRRIMLHHDRELRDRGGGGPGFAAPTNPLSNVSRHVEGNNASPHTLTPRRGTEEEEGAEISSALVTLHERRLLQQFSARERVRLKELIARNAEYDVAITSNDGAVRYVESRCPDVAAAWRSFHLTRVENEKRNAQQQQELSSTMTASRNENVSFATSDERPQRATSAPPAAMAAVITWPTLTDLFPYCWLFHEGGVYMRSDMELLYPLVAADTASAVVASSVPPTPPAEGGHAILTPDRRGTSAQGRSISVLRPDDELVVVEHDSQMLLLSGFIAAVPQHPAMKRALIEFETPKEGSPLLLAFADRHVSHCKLQMVADWRFRTLSYVESSSAGHGESKRRRNGEEAATDHPAASLDHQEEAEQVEEEVEVGIVESLHDSPSSLTAGGVLPLMRQLTSPPPR